MLTLALFNVAQTQQLPPRNLILTWRRLQGTSTFRSAPAVPAVAHLSSDTSHHLNIYRTGYHANDAYSKYLEMGSPKQLTPLQLAILSAVTRGIPEIDNEVRTGPAGAFYFSIPMNTNDNVLFTLLRIRESH